jgi:Holliday junction resolvase-like predicted endonuclease
MTVQDVFDLRNQGRIDAAYEAARQIYATDKSVQASTVMYLTALDKQQQLLDNDDTIEADKIHRALQRLLQNTPEHLILGCWGEELAVDYLRQKGYDIIERDWHSNHRDIDIIAHLDGTIVFVEVKSRRNNDFAEPESAVNYQKQKNLQLAINHYINYKRIDLSWSFDVITIIGNIGCPDPIINHIEDFQLV